MISAAAGAGSVAESRFGRVLRVVAGNRALIRLLLAYLVMVVAEFGEWLAVIVYAYLRGGSSRRPAERPEARLSTPPGAT
jgi:hypothetical protein